MVYETREIYLPADVEILSNQRKEEETSYSEKRYGEQRIMISVADSEYGSVVCMFLQGKIVLVWKPSIGGGEKNHQAFTRLLCQAKDK